MQSTFCFVSWLPPSIGERCERNFHHLVSPATIQKQLFTLTQPISGVRLLIGRCFRVPWQVCHFHCWSGMIPLCFVKLRFVKLYNCDSVSSTLIVATTRAEKLDKKPPVTTVGQLSALHVPRSSPKPVWFFPALLPFTLVEKRLNFDGCTRSVCQTDVIRRSACRAKLPSVNQVCHDFKIFISRKNICSWDSQ